MGYTFQAIQSPIPKSMVRDTLATSSTKTCYPQPILSMIRIPGHSNVQAQPRQVPANQPCPNGYTTVAPCPAGTARSKTPGGGCEPIPCPTGYTRDGSGQCQAPSPVDGRCPSPFQVMSSSCSAPNGTGLTYATRCGTPAMEAPRGPGWKPPPLPTCTPEQLVQANYTGPTAVTETDCQTGYVFQPAQGTDPAKCTPAVIPPGPQSPAEVKAGGAGSVDWLKANWKWLAALAVVGGTGYWWARRKLVGKNLGDAHQDWLIESTLADEVERRGDVLTEDEALEAVRENLPHATREDLESAVEKSTLVQKHGSFIGW